MKRGPSKKSSAPKDLLTQSLQKRDIDGVMLALTKGADPHGNMTNSKYGKAFLYEAAQINDVAFISALIDANGNPNFQAREGHWSVLHEAVTCKNIDVLGLLLRKGAQVDIYDMNNGTPLLCAVQSGNVEAARLLLENGADMHHPGYYFHGGALQCALSLGNHEMIALFDKHGIKLDANDNWVLNLLKKYIAIGDKEMAQFLINHGASLKNLEVKESSVDDRIFNLKLKLFKEHSEDLPIICQFFNALADNDIEKVEALLANPTVNANIASPNNLVLQLLMEKKHFSLIRRLLANPTVSGGFVAEATIALSKSNEFTFELLDIPAVKTQVLNDRNLANQLLKCAVSHKRYLEGSLYVMHYGADLERINDDDTLCLSCYFINSLVEKTASNLKNELIDKIESISAYINSEISDSIDSQRILNRLVRKKAQDFNPETLQVLRSLADNTYDGSYIKDLRDRLEYGVEDKPLEILGGKTLRDYVQNLKSEKPFSEQFENAGIKVPRNSPLICPILKDVMDVPVFLSEWQEVKRDNQTTQELKTFYFDYVILKKWYENSHINPLTRNKFDWSAVQPAPQLVERMKRILQRNQQKRLPAGLDPVVAEIPPTLLIKRNQHKQQRPAKHQQISHTEVELLNNNAKRKNKGRDSAAKRMKQ